MRWAIETLRREVTAIWETLDNAIAANEDYRHAWQDIAAAQSRAADLLEALASPPETVEELADRVEALAPEVHVLSDGAGSFHIDSGDLLMTAVEASPKQIRAAWFAIVGMMEVERG